MCVCVLLIIVAPATFAAVVVVAAVLFGWLLAFLRYNKSYSCLL